MGVPSPGNKCSSQSDQFLPYEKQRRKANTESPWFITSAVFHGRLSQKVERMIKEHALFSRTDVFPILTESQSKRPITDMWLKVTVFSEKVNPLLASQNFTRVFAYQVMMARGQIIKLNKYQKILHIHDCRSNITFNRPLYTCLRGRRLEVVGVRKNERARGRHERGEGEPARKAHEKRLPTPISLPCSRCVICQKFWQKTSDLAQKKRAAKKRGTFYLRSKYRLL